MTIAIRHDGRCVYSGNLNNGETFSCFGNYVKKTYYDYGTGWICNICGHIGTGPGSCDSKIKYWAGGYYITGSMGSFDTTYVSIHVSDERGPGCMASVRGNVGIGPQIAGLGVGSKWFGEDKFFERFFKFKI